MLSESERLQISVEDTGIGIPFDKQQSIFALFEQLENRELNPQGSGLGLSISSMLVARLEGDPIQVISAPQAGSTFFFQIPITSAPSAPPAVAAEEDEAMDVPNERFLVDNASDSHHVLQHSQILIVDDAPFNRLVMRKILEVAKYSYAEASTGLEALHIVKAACERNCPFAVILMDIEMPEMDGITATRELLRLASSGTIVLPVIIGCSAFNTEEDKAAALASGMTHYLEKPVSRNRLLELISLYARGDS
jgi:CheY-like chemotaxis protein